MKINEKNIDDIIINRISRLEVVKDFLELHCKDILK